MRNNNYWVNLLWSSTYPLYLFCYRFICKHCITLVHRDDVAIDPEIFIKIKPRNRNKKEIWLCQLMIFCWPLFMFCLVQFGNQHSYCFLLFISVRFRKWMIVLKVLQIRLVFVFNMSVYALIMVLLYLCGKSGLKSIFVLHT